MLGQRGDVVVGEHAVVDAELVDVAAAVVVVGSSRRLCGAMMRECGPNWSSAASKHAGGGCFAGELAVDVEADAGGFVPGEREVDPLVRLGEVAAWCRRRGCGRG